MFFSDFTHFSIVGLRCHEHHTCNDCKDPNHRNFYKEDEGFLQPALRSQIKGEVDCFLTSEITEYFYTDSQRFHKCSTDCKTCTSATDCSACQRFSDTKLLFLTKSSSSTFCTESCLLADRRYVVPNLGGYECLECPGGEYYKEGSNPPSCQQCSQDGVWLDSTVQICRDCGTGCNQCSSKENCQACMDPNESVQPDGSCVAEEQPEVVNQRKNILNSNLNLHSLIRSKDTERS